MSQPTARKRFWTYMLLVFAVAAVAFAGFRLWNTAQDHETPVAEAPAA